MDTGAMLATAELVIAPDDTALSLSPKLALAGAKLAIDAIPRWVAGELSPCPQDDAAATMAPMLNKDTGRLDWSTRAQSLKDLIRGVHPWPGATAALEGKTIKVLEAQIGPNEPTGAPGEIVAIAPQGWLVATGEGNLWLSRVQLPGKPAQSASDTARGWRELQVGMRFTAPSEAPHG
jgi:methionyl-tRNA formyltransferase